MRDVVILVVDDHETVRLGVSAALQHQWGDPSEGGPTIIQADSVETALEAIRSQKVDLAVLDLRLAEGSGLQVAEVVREEDHPTRCVVLTSVRSPKAVIRSFETGVVVAVIEKSQGISPLVEAIEVGVRGHSILTARDAEAARRQLVQDGALDRSLLNDKENRYADLVADGLSDQDIAAQMFVAPTTVRNVLSKIYKKLGIEGRNKLSALVWAERPEGGALQ